MKKFLFSMIVPAIALMAFNANAATPPGTSPLTISWKVMQEPPALEISTNTMTTIKSGTNAVGTNYDYTSKSKITTWTFGNAELIALLSHSFSNSFTGDTLAIGTNNEIYLVNGTNYVMITYPVLSVTITNTLASGAGTYDITVKRTGTSSPKTNYTGSATESQMSYVIVNYDDSTVIGSGIPTTFTVGGWATTAVDATVNSTNGSYSISRNATMQSGTGYGSIRGTNSLISGSVTAGAIKYSEY